MAKEGKLVRDRIPEIIAATGKQVRVRRLDSEERLPALHDKLDDECAEVRSADLGQATMEELADVLEVLKAVADELGETWETVEDLARSKRAERGGFAEGFWLELDQGLLPR